MRLWPPPNPFRASREEPADRELEALFLRSSRVPLPGPAEMARGRTRVAAALARAEAGEAARPAAGGLRRRLVLGGAGSAGLWATVVGTAAAHKAAAAAVGLVLVGGAVAAEGTGLAPAVREAALEAVGVGRSGDTGGGAAATPEAGSTGSGATPTPTVTSTPVGVAPATDATPAAPAAEATPPAGPAEGSNGSVEVEPAPDAPGNLVFNAQGSGETRDFTARAQLGWDAGGPFLLAAGSVRIAITEQTELRAPGRDDLALADLEALAGALVSARGQCAYEGDEPTSCTAERLQLLGGPPAGPNAGQGEGGAAGGPPEVPPGRAPETSTALSETPADAPPDEPPGAEESGGGPAGTGRPDEKGPPPGQSKKAEQ